VDKNLEEIIHRLQEKRKSTRYSELKNLMKEAGCSERPTQHGCLFSHPAVTGERVSVAKPHGQSGGNQVKSPYIDRCIDLLQTVVDLEDRP